MFNITSRPAVARVITAICAVGYPLLMFFVLGSSFSPLNPESSWGLAAEHGELAIEHWSHILVAIVAALPLAIASNFTTARVAYLLLLAAALSAALPYAVQQSHPFDSNDSWLSNYTWQLGALEVVLTPLILAGMIAAITWLWRRTW